MFKNIKEGGDAYFSLNFKGKEKSFEAGLGFSISSYEDLIKERRLWLEQEENEMWEAFSSSYRKKSFLQGRAISKKTIRQFSGHDSRFSILSGVFGQPLVFGSASPLHLSLAHSGEYAVAVVSAPQFPLGVDLEVLDGERLSSIKDQLSWQEKSLQLDGMSREVFYGILWTAREALAKALGTGFLTSFSLFELSVLKPEKEVVYGEFKHFPQFSFVSNWDQEIALTLAFPAHYKLQFHFK